MNSCSLLIFIFVFLCILLLLIISCGTMNPIDYFENFSEVNISEKMREKAKKVIKSDLKPFKDSSFNPKVLGEFYQNHLHNCILVNIDKEGKHTVTYSKRFERMENVNNFINFMKKLQKKV